jgi:nitroimidazol reductase NimA-like FMN-containing flavoprotein (pyridoxamine 5'-phosphate oxidase superfamily)
MSEKTRLNRLPERGITESEAIYAILDEGFLCHAAYVIDGRPVVIPTLYARENNNLLLHGSNTSGLVRAVRAESPLSVAVTLVDGLVVARSGFHSSANYRSVVIHGQGLLLRGEEHRNALDVIVDSLIPGRVVDSRRPTDAEYRQTSVIALSLDEMSAKVRSGGPNDDPDDMGSGTWAGVVPMRLMAGTAIPAEDLAEGIAVPDYLQPYQR